MRRLTVLAVLVLALAACGGSGGPKHGLKITFGRVGGSIISYAVTIAPNGAVTAQGNLPVKPPGSLSGTQVDTLSNLVRNNIDKLRSLGCAHALADEATDYITALGTTVAVRGSCEPRFTRVWSALTTALGLTS